MTPHSAQRGTFGGARRGVSPARRVAHRVLLRVFEEGAYADRALRAEAEGLEPRDRALARRLAFGATQRARALDHVADRLTGGRQLDAPIRAALRLGLEQVLFLDGIPDHAAVGETVELVRRHPGGGLVNAVLRRATREGAGIVDAIDDPAVRHSIPDWIARLWTEAYGRETALALMAAANEPPELALRANALRTTPDAVAAELGARVEPPDAVVVDGPLDVESHRLWHAGHVMPQSRSSQQVARLVDPQPGERVLDLCAAPGGKTTHLAALMAGRGEVVAVDRHPGRAEALRRTCERMGAANVRVEVADARRPRPDGPFDRVLVDPPCSGLGTLAMRPDLRWRMTPEAVDALVSEQRAILHAAVGALRPGGALVLSTCTLNPVEHHDHLAALDALAVEEDRTLLPHRTRSTGFQIARLRSAR